MSNTNQLFLLADHIKLSLLERQRAISLNLEPNSQDGHISRSLESMREGLEGVTNERERLEQGGGDSMYDLVSTLDISVTNFQAEQQASFKRLSKISKNNITILHHNSMASRAVPPRPVSYSRMIQASLMTSRVPQNDPAWPPPHS
jgi:syntaxin 8